MPEVDNNDFSTIELEDKTSRCESIEDLRNEIMPLLKSQEDRWKEKIREILKSSGLTKKEFAKSCGVSRVTLDKWLAGSIPNSRERFINIGLTAGYERSEMDRLLQRYGRYPGLYAKSLEDLVCLFVLEHRESLCCGENDSAVEVYEKILAEIKSKMFGVNGEDGSDLATAVVESRLLTIKEKTELEEFVESNASVFFLSFRKLYSYILATVIANEDEEINTSTYAMAQVQGWSSSLRQCISAIKQNKWYPTRNKIISIGIHLSMDYEQINQMLDIAHMEPLCAKNIFENVIIFILNDAELTLGLKKGEPGYDMSGLAVYANTVLEELDEPEISGFISELQIPDPDDEK